MSSSGLCEVSFSGPSRDEEDNDVGVLSEQLPDLSVDVAKEVHVGGSAVQTFVLHQELTEQHLGFVFLPHDLELRGEPGQETNHFQS